MIIWRIYIPALNTTKVITCPSQVPHLKWYLLSLKGDVDVIT